MERSTEPSLQEQSTESDPGEMPAHGAVAIKKIESENALIQFDATMAYIDESIKAGPDFRLQPSILLQLNRLAIQNTHSKPGEFRTGSVCIKGSKHTPPSWDQVPDMVNDMCGYVNEMWDFSPVHLCSFLMWRINWIHPFPNGNGRTSRAVSYAVMCIRLGHHLPGVPTIPEQIVKRKADYYQHLEAADKAHAAGNRDVSRMESFVEELLMHQLSSVVNKATAKPKLASP